MQINRLAARVNTAQTVNNALYSEYVAAQGTADEARARATFHAAARDVSDARDAYFTATDRDLDQWLAGRFV